MSVLLGPIAAVCDQIPLPHWQGLHNLHLCCSAVLQLKIHLNKDSFTKGDPLLLLASHNQWVQFNLHLLCHAAKQVQPNKPYKDVPKSAD